MNLKYLINKFLIFLHLRSDVGFTKLMYRGLPIILRDDFPKNKIAFINEKNRKIKVLDIKTGKLVKLEMPFNFDRTEEEINWLNSPKILK
jgi:CO dehydrogenase/acetyl-CoA synthase alpha subunit